MKKWTLTLLIFACFSLVLGLSWKHIEQYLAHRYLQSITSSIVREKLAYENFTRHSFGKYQLENLRLGKGKKITASKATAHFSIRPLKWQISVNIVIEEAKLPFRSLLAFLSAQSQAIQYQTETIPSPIKTTIQFVNSTVYTAKNQLDLTFNMLQHEDKSLAFESQFANIPLSLFKPLFSLSSLPIFAEEIEGNTSGQFFLKAAPGNEIALEGKLAFSSISIKNNQQEPLLQISPVHIDFSPTSIHFEPVTIHSPICEGVISSIGNCLAISLENPYFSSQFPNINFTPLISSEGKIGFELLLQNATYYDKSLQLAFEEIDGSIKWENGILSSSKLSGFLNDIHLVTSMQVDCTHVNNDEIALQIQCKDFSGKFSKAVELFQHFSKWQMATRIPLEGVLSAIDEGIQFSYSYSPNEARSQLVIDGKLSDGEISHTFSKASLEGFSLKFHYDAHADQLSLRDLHGVVLTGLPGKVDEYAFAGDLIQFTNLSRQEAYFDVWLGDRRRDIIRLVGTTKLTPLDVNEQQELQIVFDPLLTHFGVMHPSNFYFAIRNWQELTAFHFDGVLSLASMLHDVKRLIRSAPISLPKHPIDTIDQMQHVDGQVALFLDYTKESRLFSFDLNGTEIVINEKPSPILKLQGTYHDGICTIDQFAWNDLTLSADIIPGSTDLKIPYCGLSWGQCLNAGFKGSYNLQSSLLKAHIQFAELRPKSKLELFSLSPSDIILAQGDASVYLFNPVKGLVGEADLKIFVNDLQQPITESTIHFDTDFKTIKAALPVTLSTNALYLTVHSNLPSFDTGEFMISSSQHSLPLILDWKRNSDRDFRFYRIHGSVFGMEVDLTRDSNGKFKGESSIRSQKIKIQKLDFQNIVLPQGDIKRMSGQGTVEYAFVNGPKEKIPQISFSQDLLEQLKINKKHFIPKEGTICFDIKNQHLLLTKLKNMHSDNKLVRYSLAKNKDSTISFNGDLSLYLSLQPFNALFKLAELATFHVVGSVNHPQLDHD